MADLIVKKRADPNKLVGADPTTGNETNWVTATSSGDLNVADVPNTSATYGALTVTNSPVELKVGGSALTNRKLITIQPKGTGIYYGFSNAVTTSTGTEIFKDQTLIIPVGQGISVWLVALAGSVNVRIAELA